MLVKLTQQQAEGLLKPSSNRILALLAKGGKPLRFGEIVHLTGLSKRTCAEGVRSLREAALVLKSGEEYAPSEAIASSGDIQLNLRDQRLDGVLRHPEERAIALELHCNGPLSSLNELRLQRGTPVGTAWRTLKAMRKNGLTRGAFAVNEKILVPQDPILEIPQTSYRSAVLSLREKFSALSTAESTALIVYGPIARGTTTPTTPLNVLLVFKNPVKGSPIMYPAAKTLVDATDLTSYEHGATFALSMCPEDTVWNHLWGFVTNPNPSIQEALTGITVWGVRPKRDLREYWSSLQNTLPFGPETRSRWLKKGRLEHGSAGQLSLTPKGIATMRRLKVQSVASVLNVQNRKINVIWTEHIAKDLPNKPTKEGG